MTDADIDDEEPICEIQRDGAATALSRRALRRLVVQGSLHPDTPLRPRGAVDWRPARAIIDELLPETAAPARDPQAAPRPTRREPSRLLPTLIVLIFVVLAALLIWLMVLGY